MYAPERETRLNGTVLRVCEGELVRRLRVLSLSKPPSVGITGLIMGKRFSAL
jgi:hypothetical protein